MLIKGWLEGKCEGSKFTWSEDPPNANFQIARTTLVKDSGTQAFDSFDRRDRCLQRDYPCQALTPM
jgi:hypothetical protein